MKTGIAAVAAFVICAAAYADQYPWRWFRLQCDFRDASSVEFAEGIVRRAAATGVYNGVLLEAADDARIDVCGSWDEATRAAFRRVQLLCEKNGIEVVPSIWSGGYGSPLSVHPDLAAGVPVRGLRWKRTGSAGKFLPSGSAAAGFSGISSRNFTFRPLQDNPNSREFHVFGIEPFRLYRCRYSARAESLNKGHRFQIAFYPKGGTHDDTQLRAQRLTRKTDADWFHSQFDFYSDDAVSCRFAVGVWDFTQGVAEVKGVTIAEVPPTALLHREGTPRKIRDAATGRVYEEGRDVVFSPARSPWSKEGRSPVTVTFPAGSRVPDGGEIVVDGYAPAVIGWDQYPVCMCDPGLARHFRKSARDIAALMGSFPRKVALSNDEQRAGGTCETCRKSGLSMAQMYANMVKEEMAAVRSVSPKTEMIIWSDMMDPLHNAKPGRYFMCAGGYEGLRDLMPRDLVVGCWYRPDPEASVKGFADAGFATCAATYYDSGSLDSSRRWLRAGNATKGFRGLIYATWGMGNRWDGQDFRFLEGFAEMMKNESSPGR